MAQNYVSFNVLEQRNTHKRLTLAERTEREFKKHQLLSPYSCKRECIENICDERRKDINQQIWEQDYGQRRMWIKSKV